MPRSARARTRSDMTGRSVPPHTDQIAQALAYGFLTTDWDRESLLAAGRVVLGRNPRWLGPLVRYVLTLYRSPPVDRLVKAVERIVAAEGFVLNQSKTRVEFRGGRQRVTGIVVNERLGIPRADYDRLRAILHQARRDGVVTANRAGHPYFREHLSGRISWVESVNPQRGRRLREQFDSLVWPG